MTTGQNVNTWQHLIDKLTPEQVRHLTAVEQIAQANIDNPAAQSTAAEVLDNLAAEALWYADRNPAPGIEPDRTEQFRELLREVNPVELTTEDIMAVISLLQRGLAAKGVR